MPNANAITVAQSGCGWRMAISRNCSGDGEGFPPIEANGAIQRFTAKIKRFIVLKPFGRIRI
jgi:hypothetical protein